MNVAIGETKEQKCSENSPHCHEGTSRLETNGGKSGSTWYPVLQDYGDKKESQIFPTSPLDHNKIRVMFLISHREHVTF